MFEDPVGIWKEYESTKEKIKHLEGVMKRERPERIESTTEREFFQGKRKEIRNGKRVREKWFVFEVLQVTMARI